MDIDRYNFIETKTLTLREIPSSSVGGREGKTEEEQ